MKGAGGCPRANSQVLTNILYTFRSIFDDLGPEPLSETSTSVLDQGGHVATSILYLKGGTRPESTERFGPGRPLCQPGLPIPYFFINRPWPGQPSPIHHFYGQALGQLGRPQPLTSIGQIPHFHEPYRLITPISLTPQVSPPGQAAPCPTFL